MTGLRFFAALWVVLFHVRPFFLTAAPPALTEFVSVGFVGVGLFFVLSGFVLGYQYGDRDTRSRAGRRRFLIARIARIYPVYLLGLALSLPHFRQDSIDLIAMGLRSPAQAMATLAGAPLLLQAWSPWTSCQWNCPGWSLSAEIFFYLAFPALAVLLARLSPSRLAAVAVAAYGLAIAVPALYTGSADAQAWAARSPQRLELVASFIQYTPLLRLPEFILGIVAARAFTLGVRLPAAGGVLAAAGLVGLGLTWRGLGLPDLLVANGLLDPLFALLILSAANGRDWLGRALATRPLVWLGEASYATYILHLVLLWALLEPLKALNAPETTQLLVYLAVAVTVSLLVFVTVERPGRRWVKARLEAWLVPPDPDPVAVPVPVPVPDLAEAGDAQGSRMLSSSARITG